MSKRVSGTGVRDLRTHLGKQEKLITDEVGEALEVVLSNAEVHMVEIINTSGTGWVGKGAQAFAEGRVDTGKMRAAVGHDVSPTKTKGWIGWGLNGKPAEGYFLDQEEGFVNPWTGRYVPPMMALWGATQVAKRELRSEMRKRFA